MLEGKTFGNVKIRLKSEPPKIGKPKKKFNFKTTKKAVRNVPVADWLTDKTVDQVADMWKTGHSVQKHRKLTSDETQKFKEIKYCLQYKFDVKV